MGENTGRRQDQFKRHILLYTKPNLLAENTTNDIKIYKKLKGIKKSKSMYDCLSDLDKLTIPAWSLPRFEKNLLVLGIDNVICDYGSNTFNELNVCRIRPFLFDFLRCAYQYYEVVFWSATPRIVLLNKMENLLLCRNSNHSPLFCLDKSFVHPMTLTNGEKVLVKPLSVIWKRIAQFSSKNTLMIDWEDSAFSLNPRNGLKIEQYSRNNSSRDSVLLDLMQYIKDLALSKYDFATINHANWHLTT